MENIQTKRFVIFGAILVIVCLICIFISIRAVDKYRNKIAETDMIEKNLNNLQKDASNLDFKIKELETRRYNLSIEKEQIEKNYSTLKDKYTALGKTIRTLERDIKHLQNNIKTVEAESVEIDEDASETESRLSILQAQNDKLRKELLEKTKEKMILEIALKAQAKRLGLSEGYDTKLKGYLKDFVTSLQ